MDGVKLDKKAVTTVTVDGKALEKTLSKKKTSKPGKKTKTSVIVEQSTKKRKPGRPRKNQK
jgi:hypothetical protein